MGLTEFSMNAAAIPEIKQSIIHTYVSTAKDIYNKVMAMGSSQNIIRFLQEVTT